MSSDQMAIPGEVKPAKELNDLYRCKHCSGLWNPSTIFVNGGLCPACDSGRVSPIHAQGIAVTVAVSEQNECTSFPCWIIVDPPTREVIEARAEGSDEIFSLHEVASWITGPFFSREEAKRHLEARQHDYGPLAAVYCKSGHQSREYRQGFSNGGF